MSNVASQYEEHKKYRLPGKPIMLHFASPPARQLNTVRDDTRYCCQRWTEEIAKTTVAEIDRNNMEIIPIKRIWHETPTVPKTKHFEQDSLDSLQYHPLNLGIRYLIFYLFLFI